MSELVSIIVPTYGRTKTLKRAIDSLVNQTYRNIEIMIVDDNGDNVENKVNNKHIIEGYNDERIKYIDLLNNYGASNARNIGVEKSGGEIISFLDDDDYYHPKKIELQMLQYQKYSSQEIGFIYCYMSAVKGKKIYRTRQKKYIDSKSAIKAHMNSSITGTPSLLLRKNVFLEVGGFPDIPSSQDFMLIFNILKKGYKISCVEKVLVYYDISGSDRISVSLNKIRGLEKRYDAIYDYLNNQPEKLRISNNEILEIKKTELYVKALFSEKLNNIHFKTLMSKHLLSKQALKLIVHYLVRLKNKLLR